MNRLAERVSRDLEQIADRAAVSPGAWASILERIDEGVDEPAVGMVRLDPEPQADGPENRGRSRGWMLAAAAAVILAALIVGLFVVDDGGEEISPVVTDSPEAPETTEEGSAELVPADGVEFVNAFVNDLHDLETDAVMAFMDPDAIVKYWSAQNTDEIPGLHGHMAARGLVISVEPCMEQTDVASSGALADAMKYQCEATFVEAVSVAKGSEPYDAVVDVWLQDGQVVLLRLDWDRFERYEGELVSFFDWMADNNWESWIAMNDASGFPSGTPEANALWKQFVDQYIAEELD